MSNTLHRGLLTAAGFAAVTAMAAAQEMPKPAPELEQLKMFAGSWTCAGKAPASPFGPEHATQGHVKIARELGGFWYVIHFGEEKTKDNPMPLSGMALWGYDPGTKKFVGPGVDATGGWFHQTSAGWEADTMRWEGEGVFMGKKMGARDVFVRKGETEISHVSEAQMDGQWMKLADETCKKEAAKPAAAPKK